MKKQLIFLLIIFAFVTAGAQIKKPLVSAITDKDLRTDMYQIAADQFNGREAGTLDELKVAVWLANKAKEAGIKPAGDNGTYFQFYDMYRHQVLPASFVKLGNKSYKLWQEVLVTEVNPSKVEAPVLFLGSSSPEEVAGKDIAGKAVAIVASQEGISNNMFLFDRRYPGFVRNKYYNVVREKGAAALIIIADAQAEESWRHVVPQLTRGLYGVEGLREQVWPAMPVFWLHSSELDEVKKADQHLSSVVLTESYTYPSVNVVGKIDGTDPVLKKEYVLFSGHHDHDGIRQKYGQDSIYNGADDNASACVAMLAIARAFNKQPGKRSALFVFHGAEERGLLGSRWYAAHPTVAKESIVAVLNADMIGRNNVNQAALLGADAPHKNSDDLVKAALLANAEGPKFELDKLWDRPDHPEYFYFRSDHLPYARAGIPALFYTSVLHSEYHTPMDESEHIDFVKLRKMTEWMYRTGWIVANAKDRPKVLPDVQLER